jgi:hypothetical protein
VAVVGEWVAEGHCCHVYFHLVSDSRSRVRKTTFTFYTAKQKTPDPQLLLQTEAQQPSAHLAISPNPKGEATFGLQDPKTDWGCH